MPARKTSSERSTGSSKKSGAKKSSSKKTASAKKRTTSGKTSSKTSKRTLIEPRKGDRRFVRRNKDGEFTKDQVDVGRSLAADRRRTSKKTVPKGQGDRGDTAKKGVISKIG